MISAIKGKDVLLEVWSDPISSYIPFVCATDMSLTIQPEIINTTTASSGRGYNKQVRRIGWGLSLSGVTRITDDTTERSVFTTIQPDNIIAGYDVQMWFTDPAGNYAQVAGKVLLENANITGNQEDLSMFENAFVGVGLPQITVHATGGSGTPGAAMVLVSDYWTTTPNANTISGLSAVHGYSIADIEQLLESNREGMLFNLVTTAPVGRQCRLDKTLDVLEFDANLPFNPNETVFLLFYKLK